MKLFTNEPEWLYHWFYVRYCENCEHETDMRWCQYLVYRNEIQNEPYYSIPIRPTWR